MSPMESGHLDMTGLKSFRSWKLNLPRARIVICNRFEIS
jgi:hypothetical protein